MSSHHLIGNSRASSMNLWEMQDAKSGLQVKGQTLTDGSAVLLSMVGSGVGIARLLGIVAAPFVKTGKLVPLLRPHFDVQEIPVYAVMLPKRHRLPKIRACVEFWGGVFGGVQRHTLREIFLANPDSDYSFVR